MAEDEIKLKPLVVDISATTARLEKALKRIEAQNSATMSKVQRDATAGMKRFETALASADRRMAGFGRTLLPSMGVIAAALSTRQIMKYADGWTQAGNKIAAASQIAGRSARTLEGIREIADRARSGLAETADLYAKILRATPNVAKSEVDVAKATEIVAKAFKAGGAAASEQAAGILQLSQALGSGLLQGDELRSIRENAPLLAQAIATEFKTTVAGLKQLGAEGQLTTDRVFAAILKAQPKIEAAFGATNSTIADSMTKVENAFQQYIGQTDSSLGASERLKHGLAALADNFDVTADFALQLASVIAGALVGRSIVAMIAKVGVATESLIAFGRALAAARAIGMASAFGSLGAAAGPLGAVIGGVLVGSMVLFSGRAKDAAEGAKTYAAALRQVEDAAKESANAVDNAAQTITEQNKNSLSAGVKTGTEAMEEARQAASDLFDQLFQTADMSAISPEQISELESIRSAFDHGTASAEQTKQALYALANSNPDFQAVADEFAPVLDAITKAIAATGILKKQFADLGVGPSFRQTENDSMTAYRDMQAAADKFLADAKKRNALSKDELALENEIAKVKAEAEKSGIVLSEKRIAALAAENLAAEKRRSSEGKKERETNYGRLTKQIEQATAAQLVENDVLARANPLLNDYGLALAKARAEIDLINAAKEDGREITPELTAEIGQMATKYAQATAAGNKLQDVQDKIRQEAEEMSDMLKDTFESMVDALFEAGDIGQKLIGIFANLGRQFSKMGAERLFDYLTGKRSNLDGLFSIGGGASVVNARTSGIAIGETIAPPIVQSLNKNLDTYAAAIRKIESGSYAGNYSAVGPLTSTGDQALGAYQVMASNVGAWTKEVLGVAMTQKQFLSDRAAQDKVFYAKFGQSLDKFGSFADAISVWFSGKPLSAAGNASDGYNTVPAYLSKVQDAANSFRPGVLQQGVSSGVQDGIRKVSLNNADPWLGLRETSVATAGASNNFGAVLGVAGAGIGAFAGGYQSADPAMGAISGALNGLAVGGPIGAAIGAVVGLRLGGTATKYKRISA